MTIDLSLSNHSWDREVREGPSYLFQQNHCLPNRHTICAAKAALWREISLERESRRLTEKYHQLLRATK